MGGWKTKSYYAGELYNKLCKMLGMCGMFIFFVVHIAMKNTTIMKQMPHICYHGHSRRILYYIMYFK